VRGCRGGLRFYLSGSFFLRLPVDFRGWASPQWAAHPKLISKVFGGFLGSPAHLSLTLYDIARVAGLRRARRISEKKEREGGEGFVCGGGVILREISGVERLYRSAGDILGWVIVKGCPTSSLRRRWEGVATKSLLVIDCPL